MLERVVPQHWHLVHVVTAAVIMVACLVGMDSFIQYQQASNPLTKWAYLDGVAHGLAAIAVTAPIWLRSPMQTWIAYFLVAGLLGGLIDLDHYVAAGSTELGALISMSKRPPTHSMTFAIVLTILVLVFTKDKLMGWVVFAALASHVVRDASGFHTPLFWPLDNPHRIPYALYPVIEIVLLCASYLVVHKTTPPLIE